MIFGDIQSRKLIVAKGILFLFVAFISFAGICLLTLDWKIIVCLCICVWSFCRFYYFAFYVIEKYVDPAYRFSGLFSFFRYILSQKNKNSDRPEQRESPQNPDNI
jgi:hypothetical protein